MRVRITTYFYNWIPVFWKAYNKPNIKNEVYQEANSAEN